MSELYRFAAFISYSSRDAAFARRLHRALESYRIPTQLGAFDLIGQGKRNRLFPVFRDREELPSGELGAAIEASLKASNSLIIVCSPHAAASPWVNKEIESFLALGRRGRIFAIIADTAPLTDASGADATASCFPPAFRGDALSAEGSFEPLAADARRGRDGFRNAWLKIVAGLIGVNAGALQDRDRKRRRAQALQVAAGAITLASGLSYGAAWLDASAWRGALSAYPEQVRGGDRETDAAAFAIAGVAEDSALVPAHGARADDVLTRAGSVKRLRDLGSLKEFKLTPDGSLLVTLDKGDVATIIDVAGRAPDRMIGRIDKFVVSADGAVLATIDALGDGRVYDVAGGGDPRPLGNVGRLGSPYLTPDGKWLVIDVRSTTPDTAMLYETATGRAIPLGEVESLGGVHLAVDGWTLATRTPEGVLTVRDLARSEAPRSLGPTTSFDLSSSGDALVAYRPDGSAVFLDVGSGADPQPVVPPPNPTGSQISATGAVLTGRGATGAHEVINLRTGQRRTLPLRRQTVANAVADGDYAMSWGLGRLTVDNLATGDTVLDFPGDRWMPSMDGRTIVVVAPDGSAVRYDVGTQAQKPLGNLGPLDFLHVTDDGSFLFGQRPDGTALRVDLRGEGGIRSLGELRRQGSFGGFAHAPNGVIALRTEAGAALLYDAAAPSPALDASGRALGGAALRRSVCATNADTLLPFSPATRVESAPENADDRQVHAILVGRPWNPCDWRGLAAGPEGWAQWLRRVDVAVLGKLSRDYKCGEINAAGDVSPARITSCRRAGVPDAMIATAR